MTEPESDHGQIDASLTQFHGRSMPQDMRCDALLSQEVLSNVVDGRRAHPAISGGLFHFTIDEGNTLDDLGNELVAGESAPLFLRLGGQFEDHGKSGCT